MLTEVEKSCASDLLKELDVDDLNELAKTITGGVLQPLNLQDSVNAILQHTEDLKTLLWRKKITKATLFKYLHNRNVCFPGNAEKASLVEIVINFWLKNNSAVNRTNDIQSEAASTADQPYTLRNLAVKFAEWFYSRVNTIVMEKFNENNSGTSERLKEEDFWSDAKMFVKLTNGSRELVADYTSDGSKDCVALISHVCTEHSLFFSPNLGEEGTRATSEPHGLVLVLNCGTLHAAVGHHCVGVYEQVFGLIKDPVSDHNWKIKSSQLILRSQEVKTTPVLTSGNQVSISGF